MLLVYLPGTPNNYFLMDGNGETTIFHVKTWNHPTETTVERWLFRVPGSDCFPCEVGFKGGPKSN